MKKIIVTGGCGYIGSHTIIELLDNGFEVVSIDNLSNATENVLESIRKITEKRVKNYAVDLCDLAKTRQVFGENSDAVGIIHFAALKSVGDSMEQPLVYFENNLMSLLHILRCMTEFDIKNLLFSSSCSVYGNAQTLPVTEETPWQTAESPYGRTKQMGEQIISDFLRCHTDFNAILLRYFNPAGAHESALLGESPRNKPNNLVPIIIETAAGKRDSFTVFGNDYDTRDGSCIRDYIHVMDLANAHLRAMNTLLGGKQGNNCDVFNVGVGEGVTVLEAINAFEKVSGIRPNFHLGARRAGDVVAIYSDYQKAARELGWQPRRNIEDIMRTAWAWHLAQK